MAADVIGDRWADAPNVGPALDFSLAVPCCGRQSPRAKPPDRRVPAPVAAQLLGRWPGRSLAGRA